MPVPEKAIKVQDQKLYNAFTALDSDPEASDVEFTVYAQAELALCE